uniref:Protein C21orf2 n=1 Tax=Schistocephalus solidus TaxID=70667 RepID=A0A0V0J337_SCHSO
MDGQSLTESMILMRAQNQTLESVKRVNLWGLNIKNVSLLRSMPMLEVISLSSNKIESLEEFAHCPTLRELYLRNNNIASLDEIRHLRGLPHLHTLFLLGNPCCYAPDIDHVDNSTEPATYYRPTVISQLPSLERLDMRSVTEEEKRAAAVELPSVGDSLYNKENIPHERIFADNQAYTENNFEEETITRPSLPVLPTVPTSPSYSDKNTPVFESPISGEAAMRPVPPLLFSQETLDSARAHIPTFNFATKQALMEILQLLPKLNSDALVLLSNEIVHRFRFLLASEYEK